MVGLFTKAVERALLAQAQIETTVDLTEGAGHRVGEDVVAAAEAEAAMAGPVPMEAET